MQAHIWFGSFSLPTEYTLHKWVKFYTGVKCDYRLMKQIGELALQRVCKNTWKIRKLSTLAGQARWQEDQGTQMSSGGSGNLYRFVRCQISPLEAQEELLPVQSEAQISANMNNNITLTSELLEEAPPYRWVTRQLLQISRDSMNIILSLSLWAEDEFNTKCIFHTDQ